MSLAKLSPGVQALLDKYLAELGDYSTATIEAVLHEQITADLKQMLGDMARRGDSWARAEYERRYGPVPTD